jgi:5-methylthioadenosine/S-adenosylhomocysteine deaminase
MLAEMQSAAMLGKAVANDAAAVPAETALAMATINGAKALGIDDLTGSLQVGKAADITAIDLNQLETRPLYNPVSQIVYAADRQQVTHVWCNGKMLLKDRQLQTLDMDKLLANADSWQEKLKAQEE